MSELRNHVVLCGLGHVGSRVLERLCGVPVVAVAARVPPRARSVASAAGAVVVEGDATDQSILAVAGAERARAVIAVTDSDQTNIEIALAARELNPAVPVVVRLFDQGFSREIEAAFGLHRAIGTSGPAGHAFAAAAVGDHVVAALDMGGRPAAFLADTDVGGAFVAWLLPDGRVVRDRAEGALAVAWGAIRSPGTRRAKRRAASAAGRPGAHLESLRRLVSPVSLWLLAAFAVVFATAAYVFQRALGIPVVDAIYFTGTVLTTTGFGDFNLQGSADAVKLFGVTMMFAGAALLAAVYAVVADVVLAVRLEQMLGRTSHRVRGHVVVVGLGRVGYRTACALLDMGRKVIAIEKDAESPFVEEIRRRAPVVIGDARYARTLAAANVAGAESVAALTENDVLNLEIALASRKAAPGIRVVVRTWDRDLAARLARHGGIDRALSASALAAPAFVEAVLRPDVLHAFDWDGRRVEVVSGTATAGGNEGVLLSRRPGTDGSWAFTPGSASPGDEVIRVRMPGAQPIESSAATSAPIASR